MLQWCFSGGRWGELNHEYTIQAVGDSYPQRFLDELAEAAEVGRAAYVVGVVMVGAGITYQSFGSFSLLPPVGHAAIPYSRRLSILQ